MNQFIKYKDNTHETYYSALTIDVEDGINIAMRDYFNIEMKPTDRVLENVNIILDIFGNNNIKATFFILGEVAESFPDLVKKIDRDGHEIGIHGYHHDQVFKLSPEKFKNDIKNSRDLIENMTGKKVFGFRAPAFSIRNNTLWALKILAECGFVYDSSISPSLSPRYGWQDFSKKICRAEFNNAASIIEVPLSTVRFFGKYLPVCGGGYLRYFPYAFTRKAFKTISKDRPVIVYLHPYELDTEKYPDFFYEARSKAPLKQRLSLILYRYKKATVRNKLRNLTQEFHFIPLIDIIRNFEKNDLIEDVKFL